jgi:hypothetical protein
LKRTLFGFFLQTRKQLCACFLGGVLRCIAIFIVPKHIIKVVVRWYIKIINTAAVVTGVTGANAGVRMIVNPAYVNATRNSGWIVSWEGGRHVS